jgi:hypothetical protein
MIWNAPKGFHGNWGDGHRNVLRNVSAMLDDYEARLEKIIEENTLLQTELEEKDALHVYVQRLREETRDLKQELAVRDVRSTAGIGAGSSSGDRPAATVAPFHQSTSVDHSPMDVDAHRLPGRLGNPV